MREIKFRGKTPEGKWIYGGISINEDRVWIDQEYLGDTFVDKETLGQFTGLKDKNGKEVYDNMEIDNKYIVLYEECKYILKDISNNDIIDLWRYINENGGKITKEYTKI